MQTEFNNQELAANRRRHQQARVEYAQAWIDADRVEEEEPQQPEIDESDNCPGDV